MIIQVGKENCSAEQHGYRRLATCVLSRASRAVLKKERFEKMKWWVIIARYGVHAHNYKHVGLVRILLIQW
jgi:hypothetical protein